MAYQAYSNFKNGLDTRRSELTTQPGSLVEIQDAHVNEGAEVEQRRAFLNASYVPLRTFGLEVTSSGPIVFTDGYDVVATVSRAETATTATLVLAEPFLGGIGDNIIVTGLGNSDYNGSWVVATVSGTTVTFLNNSGNSEVTTGDTGGTVSFNAWYNNITYQTLQHPAVYFGATYNATYHKMTGVTASTSFGGEAWVSATFADGKTYVYYNGIPVPAWYRGTILSGWTTNNDIATILANSITALNPTGVTNWTATSPSSGVFTFYSSAGLSFTPVIGDPSGNVTVNGNQQTVTSGSGTLTVTQLLNSTSSSSGVQATGYFYILGGSLGTITVSVNGVQIVNTAVSFDTNFGQTALDVAAAINSYVATPSQYTAIANSTTGQVSISAAAAGTTANGYAVGLVVTGNIIFDNAAFTLPSTSGASCTAVTVNSNNILSATVTCSATNYTAWAQAIAANIAAYSGTSGYTAYAGSTGQTVMISRLSTATAAVTTYTVTVNGSTTNTSDASQSLSGTTPLNVSLSVPANQKVSHGSSSQTETLNVSGGTVPYTYLWVIASDTLGTGNGSATLSSSTTSSVVVQNLKSGETVTIFCTVTDSTSPTKLTGRSPIITITR